MAISIHPEPFDPWQALTEYQQEHVKGMGATAVFVGTMRDLNEGDEVRAMYLEHYPGMTEKAMQRLETDAHDLFGLMDVLIMHRVGDISPGDPIVLVATWSSHRKEAFESCRQIMESLKSTVPFWKKETLL
ncbi:MAG: molybdenum cofactor biosynthesis protein MoaE, partial [Gammaproteobacteria bacterium]